MSSVESRALHVASYLLSLKSGAVYQLRMNNVFTLKIIREKLTYDALIRVNLKSQKYIKQLSVTTSPSTGLTVHSALTERCPL